MTDILTEQSFSASHVSMTLRKAALILCVLVAVGITALIGSRIRNLSTEDDLLRDSTLGELAVWMAGQTEEEEIESFLAQFAENQAQAMGQDRLEPELLLTTMQNILVAWTLVLGVSGVIAVGMILTGSTWASWILLATLIGMDLLLFAIPVVEGDNTLGWVLAGIIALLIALLILLGAGKVSRVMGFIVALSVLLVLWESAKGFAASVNYKITLPQATWEYTSYPTTEAALDALAAGDESLVIVDRRDLADLMPPYPEEEAADDVRFAYPELRYLDNLDETTNLLIFPIEPDFSGRLSAAVRAEDAARWQSAGDFSSQSVATVTGTFAEENYLAADRNLVLVNFKILNDLNLPHLQSIAEAYLQPARRNGSLLLARILADAGLYTWGEALFGFLIGALLGFLLGTAFAHSALVERSLLPYVVASQTVPILAIAPMVVIWLGASQASVSVIAAYLTFFPVTINTLRGLQSPKPTAVELLQSYAASRWTIMWKLRFPAALPYIFTALKVSATASVVGAIIGELPSGIGDGLGRAILDFSSDYSLISTPKLWASIIMAAMVRIVFFVIVSVIEQLVLSRYLRRS